MAQYLVHFIISNLVILSYIPLLPGSVLTTLKEFKWIYIYQSEVCVLLCSLLHRWILSVSKIPLCDLNILCIYQTILLCWMYIRQLKYCLVIIVETFHNIFFIIHKYQENISKLDNLCSASQLVTFVRNKCIHT